MNKEEIEYMYKVLTEQWGNTDNYVNDLLSYSKRLQQENKELKEQIIDYSYKLSHFASEETYEKEIKQLQERIDILKETQLKQLQIIKGKDERIDKAIEILGEYKHYSVPDEKQNSENEDIVDKSLEILKGDSNE